MIFERSRRNESFPIGYFHLEEEKTKTRAFGFSGGEYIQLKDEYGDVWVGSAMRDHDDMVIYRLRNSRGRSLSGMALGSTLTLRDERGSTWKGFIS